MWIKTEMCVWSLVLHRDSWRCGTTKGETQREVSKGVFRATSTNGAKRNTQESILPPRLSSLKILGFFHFRGERRRRDKAIFFHSAPVNFLTYVSLFAGAFSAVRQKANQRLLPLGQVTPAWTKRESNIIPSLGAPRARSPVSSLPCSEKTLVLVIRKLQEIFI